MRSIFLAHHARDHEFALRLAPFLELGCNVTCSADEGLIGPEQDIVDKAEEGVSSDVLILLMSAATWPANCPRERWEPVLFGEADRAGTELITIMLEESRFPALLRRKNFFDASADRQSAMRRVKRWLWQRTQGAAHSVNNTFSSDLEDLYCALSDHAGTLRVSGPEASRFAKEASQEFEAVLWVPCHDRTLAQVAGDLGAQLGLTLEGPAPENCERIRDLLFSRRCLLILDAPAPEHTAELMSRGRTSILVTDEPVKSTETPRSLAYARKLIGSHRYAEAYELLQDLLEDDVSPSDCARELSWICEQWNRVEESDALRVHYHLPPTEQLSLF